MATNWLPGATVIASSHDGGSMTGGNSYVTWHSYEADPNKLSASAGAKYLISSGNEVHLCFNPVTGQIVQILPANRAGRGLVNQPGGVQTNRAGRVNIQIEVVGFARNPWTRTLTAEGKKGLARILAWLDSWGIPRDTPAGMPPATSAGPFNRIAPAASGHTTHSQWKENAHWDHGAVPWADIFSVVPDATPVNNLPKPKPPAPKKPAPTKFNRSQVGKMQRALRISLDDSKWGPGTDSVACNFRNAAYPSGRYNVRTVQRAVGVTADGIRGPKTNAAIIRSTRTMQSILGVTVDGDWGPNTDRAFFTFRKEWKGRY